MRGSWIPGKPIEMCQGSAGGAGFPKASGAPSGRSLNRYGPASDERSLITRSEMFAQLGAMFGETQRSPFDFIVVDESQDVGVAQLRFLAALGADRTNGLFFAGDLGQRIFQQPFSWQALGVEVRGRSRTLKINYRTSHQIRRQSDLLLGAEIADADGNAEGRAGTISVFNGPEPAIVISQSIDEEAKVVADWLMRLAERGLEPHEISVFVRSTAAHRPGVCCD